MSRVAVTDEDGKYAGHFDLAKADWWTDRDPVTRNGSGGTGCGEAVVLTAGGKWVLEHWTDWQGQKNRYEWITAQAAQEWLTINGEDAAVAEHFGGQPEEIDARAGRPEIGGAVHVRLGDALAAVDRCAQADGVTRAEWVRRTVEAEIARRASA